jgi:hypothetical protein
MPGAGMKHVAAIVVVLILTGCQPSEPPITEAIAPPAPMAEVAKTPAPMPSANAEPDQYATQGWSCKVHFMQVGNKCEKQSPELLAKLAEEEKKRKAQSVIDRKNEIAFLKKDRAARRKEGVSIGMTPEEVRYSSWGRPESINRSTNVYGNSEQWVYGGQNYLYFENGRLTNIQN